ncbi:chorismate mutase [Labrys wisconsinensis]|uniref:chorismate mutase n=1 Tax=Labrys wisconsinensis TaxID=425677 RepID=A0ABU0JKC3_9HYPH|nr:chorismate mutase [Labrys wisconsinensis]MDQ0473848.1 chorismate mutase [Labrys wisconsinensis]
MTETPVSLADLRREIDRIDAAMHGLLMERGEIISQLIAVKRSQETGSAFRPGREAAMMREIVGRHRGILPVDIVESIWRVIIATFTHVQAPYAVHGDVSLGGAAMRDVARFHFGFVVPYETHDDASDVIHAVAASRGDLGLVPVAAAGAWWRALEPAGAPKVIARLPFVERADHPAAMPCYVLSKPVDEASAGSDIRLYSVVLPEAAAPAPAGFEVTARAGAALLISLPGAQPVSALADALPAATAIHPVGSHAAAVPHPV